MLLPNLWSLESAKAKTPDVHQSKSQEVLGVIKIIYSARSVFFFRQIQFCRRGEGWGGGKNIEMVLMIYTKVQVEIYDHERTESVTCVNQTFWTVQTTKGRHGGCEIKSERERERIQKTNFQKKKKAFLK